MLKDMMRDESFKKTYRVAVTRLGNYRSENNHHDEEEKSEKRHTVSTRTVQAAQWGYKVFAKNPQTG
jgi:hypothetical protein